ncbi:ATP-binding protein [Algoriphagus namhaensis]
MKITPQIKAELENWLDRYWTTYLRGDLETWATFIKKDYYNIGGTKEEIWHSKQEILDYSNAIADQLIGQAQLRNRTVEASAYGEFVMLNEFTDMYVKAGKEWIFYGHFRMSSLMEKTAKGWIVQHQHGSFPDTKAAEGEAFGLDAIKAENERLKKAVEERTAELELQKMELEIESALERVRAVAMGMKTPDDMLQVCRVIASQLDLLGVRHIRNVQTAIIESKEEFYLCYQFFPSYDQDIIERTEYPKNPVELDMVNQMLAAKDNHFMGVLTNEELKDFREHRKNENYLTDPLLDQVNELGYCFLSIGDGGLGLSLYQSLDEQSLALFKRFHQVFSLAYQRFRDIQKAVAQTKEAEIQLALERVRAKTMAMNTQSDLLGVIKLFGEQLNAVNIRFDNLTFIEGAITKYRDWDLWSYVSLEGGLAFKIHIPYIQTPYFNKTAKAVEEYEKTGQTIHVKTFTNREKNEFLDHYWKHVPEMPKELVDPVYSSPGSTIVDAFMDQITVSLVRWDLEDYRENELKIFERFAKEFRQTYIRFLDIKKAEAQAREAQIEAALERVRAQTMAMHSSEDVGQCIVKMFNELTALGVDEGTRFGIGILNHENENNQLWTARKNGDEVKMHIGNLDMTSHPLLKKARKAWKEQIPFHQYILEGQDLLDYYQMLNNAPDYKIHIPLEKLPKKEIQHCFIFEHGFFYAFSPNEFQPELIQITQRFSAQFAQTYRRYLDLVKAEAQSREARIEAGLERVRSKSLAMHQTSELQSVIHAVHEELLKLDLSIFGGSFIVVNSEVDHELRCWGSGGTADTSDVVYIPRFDKPFYTNLLEGIKKGPGFFTEKYSAAEKEEFFTFLFTHEPWSKLSTEEKKKTLEAKRDYTRSCVVSEHTSIFIINQQGIPFSESDNAILKRFGKVFEQSYTRFLDLQKAEAQAKEARVEVGLEKIRSRTMGMQSSAELPEVANLLFLEVQGLGVPSWSSGFNVLLEDRKSAKAWMSSEGTIQEPFVLRLWGEASFDEMGAFIKSKENFMVQELGGEELVEHYQYMKSFPDLKPTFEKLEEQGIPLPTFQINHLCKFSHGFLLFITYEPVPEAHQIFRRFAKVFEQTYTRFLDLKRAEAQAKEAQIEAALERVRSRTMGMQKAAELGDVAQLLFAELNTLVDDLWTCGFVLCEKDQKEDEWWLSLDNGLIQPFSLPNFGDFAHESLYQGWVKGETYRTVTLENEQLQTHYDWLMGLPIAKQIFEDMESSGIPRPNWQRLHAAYFKTGYLVIITEIPCEGDEIFKRFAQVFDQTYTRFLDLQKAEAQAREAQVELSLERIRAQVTAMKESSELFDIVVAMRKEFIKLGHEADYFWHMKWTEKSYEMSMTSEEGDRIGMVISIPKFVHDDIPRLAEWEKSDSPIIALDLDGPEAWDYIAKMNTYGKYEQVDPHAPTEEDIMAIGGLTFVIARTTHGEIGFSLAGQVPEPRRESLETLIRFAGVFDLAYRRFEDLQTSEKQTRKAKIELALERVRARAMAMQKPEELVEVAQVLREEMGLLGVEELETSSIYINQGEQGKAQCWYSIKDIRDGAKTYMADHFDLSYKDTWVGKQMLAFYQSDQTNTSILMQGEHRIEWINYCAKRTKKLDGYYGNEIPERTYHLTKFSNGAIGAATPGEISPESWELLRRAATVFSLAYSRFRDLSQAKDDLKKLKRAKAKAEKALKELKAAQEQLVQQEKLASLGQLTAGIAHEIKNPLNFVNNFSDLSRELIEEILEERTKNQDSRDESLIDEILADIKSNLQKVYEHGSRADGIVKSMLQHSRASGSKREAKAFNPMVQEFVNLSFHGMRAGKAPINVEIDLQLDPKVGEVDLISEDFSRVILNLCNNAFDAMRDKLLKTEDGRPKTEDSMSYLPKLTVKTALHKDKVALSIGDNGSGIPAEIQDKILQPFFTTKKGTEGTGLGLSITHDIIKAHGGELKVESTLGAGSVFYIALPLN